MFRGRDQRCQASRGTLPRVSSLNGSPKGKMGRELPLQPLPGRSTSQKEPPP